MGSVLAANLADPLLSRDRFARVGRVVIGKGLQDFRWVDRGCFVERQQNWTGCVEFLEST